LRTEVSSLEKQRDNYRDKYQDYKQKNNILNVKLNEIEDDFRKIILEKQVESFEKKKEEDIQKKKPSSYPIFTTHSLHIDVSVRLNPLTTSRVTPSHE
jgi:hypothetical protein